MKIAQVCPYDMDRPGGVQSHIRDMAAALRELGHEVTIVASRSPADGPQSAAEPHVRRFGSARSIRFGATQYEITAAFGEDRKRLRALMRDGGFDVVHYHTFWTPLLPLQAYRDCDAPSVATFHDTTPPTASGRLLRLLFLGLSRIILPWFDEVIAVSASPLAHLRGAKRPIAVMPPAIDLRRFAAVPAAPAAKGQKLTILFVGRLEQRKGVPVLLEAYRRLSQERAPVRLIVAGGGPDEGALRRFAEAHRLDVDFVGRFPDADKPRLYAEAGIVCAPSLYGESFGLVLVEAMASGRPVAAAANSGFRTVLTGEGALGLTPPGDAGALHAALRGLISDPDLRARLSAWGRAEAMKYDCRALAPGMVALYRSAIAGHDRTGEAHPVAKARSGD